MASPIKHLDLVMAHYRRNRTIVSRDIGPMLEAIAGKCGANLVLHRYPSGADIGTWIVPDRWDVKEAWVKDPSGNVVASYDEHPLFMVPYSRAFRGTVTKDELLRHTRFHPKRSDAFFYEHRFAYDFKRRMSDWAITMPRERFESLPEGNYEVRIDLDVGPGEMLVGEVVLPGESSDSIALLTDYCHPGQVNDSFSGILAMIDVFNALKSRPRRRFTYRLLFFPETIGSCILLQDRPDYLDSIKFAIFSEFVGWGRNWMVTANPDSSGLGSVVGNQAAQRFEGLKLGALESGYGNDEIIFDYAGIPAVSVQMSECDEYHSSLDSPDRIEQANLDRAAEIVLYMCETVESGQRYRMTQQVPFYQTRFDLYADSVLDRRRHLANRRLFRALRGGATMQQLVAATGGEESELRLLLDRMIEFDLVRKEDLG